MKFGKIRERPKIEDISYKKYKMCITFTNFKDAGIAIKAFPVSQWVSENSKKDVSLYLSYFHSKQNKIYVSGLKDNSERAIKQIFEKYGQVTEITLRRTKNNVLAAILAYTNEYILFNTGMILRMF